MKPECRTLITLRVWPSTVLHLDNFDTSLPEGFGEFPRCPLISDKTVDSLEGQSWRWLYDPAC
jgi:hypothetical protein